MKIGIIGTGNMGAGLAALFSGKHDVFIGHRDPAKAAELANKIGASVQGGGIAAAISVADIVILATPYPAATDVFSAAGDLAGKVLVDISNPVSADFSELVIGHETSAAEEIQKLIPGANVVKAFNTLFAQLLPEESRQSNKLQVFIAGDNELAREQVAKLATSVNLEPVYAGPLKNSRYLEPIGAMNIQFGYFLGQGPVVAPAWVKA
ncbi:NADPH-dependent F420 reductase [Pectobacterium brasiliense]|uniref:NADPH-dependent F420 reductase n=1 Tax=Pectobacterium brasiliense TaxID=180957 RepID=UPI0030183E95